MSKSSRPRGQIRGMRSIGPLRVGDTVESLEVDTAKLKAPNVEYDADFAWAEYRLGTVSLFFCKNNRDASERLASRLELRLGGEDAIRLVSGSRDFFENLHERSTHWLEKLRRKASPAQQTADKTHSQWASYLYVAFSGTRAVIDAFELSVPGVARYLKDRDYQHLELRGVVRVQMSVFDLAALLEQLEGIIPEVLSDLVESGFLSRQGADDVDQKVTATGS